MKFDGSSGRKPHTEARRYVYAVLAAILDHESADRDGWVYGGIDDEFDRRRLKKAVIAVQAEMMKKATRP